MNLSKEFFEYRAEKIILTPDATEEASTTVSEEEVSAGSVIFSGSESDTEELTVLDDEEWENSSSQGGFSPETV